MKEGIHCKRAPASSEAGARCVGVLPTVLRPSPIVPASSAEQVSGGPLSLGCRSDPYQIRTDLRIADLRVGRRSFAVGMRCRAIQEIEKYMDRAKNRR